MERETDSDMDLARDRLSDQVFRAHTLAEIAEAREALRQWMRDYPDEPGMADGFEVLSHAQDYADEDRVRDEPC